MVVGACSKEVGGWYRMSGAAVGRREVEEMGNGNGARVGGWEWLLVAGAVLCALGLGGFRLGVASIWHDEAIQVYVADSILRTGKPLVPGGYVCASSPLFNALLAGVIAVAGDGEAAVRAPSVVFAGVNVLLMFLVTRPLLGRGAALLAAWLLALSPWSVAWSREARFYSFQVTWYLAMMWCVWRLFSAEDWRRCKGLLLGIGAIYLCGILTSLHSVLFLAAPGVAAAIFLAQERRLRSRWTLACCGVGVLGVVTMAGYYAQLPRADFLAIFKEAHIGVSVTDPVRPDRWYYFDWLWSNLSSGLFAAALAGSALMVWRERRRGVVAALAFWAPLLIMTFLISYRRPRFMYFAFPFYIAAVSYALVWMAAFVASSRRGVWRLASAVVLGAVLVRLGASVVFLTCDAIAAARGADATLATRHPQWRKPCLYVRDRLQDGSVVISTEYASAYYYMRRVDDWYPSRCIPWEVDETGMAGLRGVSDLERYMAAHPKGYFLADWWRFDVPEDFAADRAWVQAHLRRIDEASSADVTLYAWGGGDAPTK